MLNKSINFVVCRSKRVTRQNTQVTRVGWGGGGNYVGAFVCERGALRIGRHFLMLDLLIWWKLNGMWGYLLFERLQGVQTVHGGILFTFILYLVLLQFPQLE